MFLISFLFVCLKDIIIHLCKIKKTVVIIGKYMVDRDLTDPGRGTVIQQPWWKL